MKPSGFDGNTLSELNNLFIVWLSLFDKRNFTAELSKLDLFALQLRLTITNAILVANRRLQEISLNYVVMRLQEIK